MKVSKLLFQFWHMALCGCRYRSSD